MTLSPRALRSGRKQSLERAERAQRRERPERPERLECPERPERREVRAFAVLPYALLLAASVLDIGERGGFTDQALIDVGLAAATGAWMAGMDALRARPARGLKHAWLMAFCFVVLVALGAALVIRAPWFGFYTWTGNLWVFRALRGRWRIAGLVAIAALTSISQDGGQLPGSSASSWLIFGAIVLINLGATGAVVWFALSTEEQKRRREQSITELTEANLKLESTLRENAGLHAQLLAQAREAGILDERQRMAREIHDTLAQGLTGIITQLQAADQAGLEAADRRRHFDAAQSLARESLSEARRSVQAMRPEPLEAARLPEALGDIVARWSALHGVAAELTTTGTRRKVALEIEIALLRTAQEGLANVAKHARAGRVGLTLSYMEDLVTLDVRDDGAGFEWPERSRSTQAGNDNGDGRRDGDREHDGDSAADGHGAGSGERTREGGYGLAAMRERMQALSGTLEIESEPGRGTAISATVPALAVESVT